MNKAQQKTCNTATHIDSAGAGGVEFPARMNAWLGVVSRAHVQRGVAGSFAQLCHGKAQPLRRMQGGDWLIYYSPTIEMGGEPLRSFTAGFFKPLSAEIFRLVELFRKLSTDDPA